MTKITAYTTKEAADALAVSASSVRKYASALEEAGHRFAKTESGARIIKRVAMIRPVMKGYGANVIQVLPACEAIDEQSGRDTRPIPAEPTPAKHAEPFVKKHSFSLLLSSEIVALIPFRLF